MEAFPPSYAVATSRQHWTLIAPYLSAQDLTAASLVCKKWNLIFAKQLWGDPSSHFDSQDSTLVKSLSSSMSNSRHADYDQAAGSLSFDIVQFRRCCKIARSLVRHFTHTLKLPSQSHDSSSSLYSTTSTGLPATWLRDLVAILPRLQSLVARNVHNIDHECLFAFAPRASDVLQDWISRPGLSERLKLLDLSRCYNVTARGLTALLCETRGLLYLDVSGIRAMRDIGVLRALQDLEQLKVLIMCGVDNLHNDSVTALAEALARRLLWLNIENCGIAEYGVRLLLALCVGNGRSGEERPPAYDEAPPERARRITDPSQFAKDMYESLTSGTATHLSVENSSYVGITHLKIGSNRLTSLAATNLLNSGEFVYLDLGSSPFSPPPEDASTIPRPPSGHQILSHLRVPAQFFFTNFSQFVNGRNVSRGNEDVSHLAVPVLPRILRHTRVTTLTAIPAHATTRELPKQIINLIRAYARASQQQKHYSVSSGPMPPIPAHSRLKQQPLNSSTTLLTKTLVLEVVSLSHAAISHFLPPKSRALSSRGWNYAQDTRTVTGDADSEALWRHAEGEDFSFFDEAQERKEEVISPAADVGTVDVVAEVARFRQHAKRKWEGRRMGQMAGGLFDGAWGGYEFGICANDFWDGEVKVLRV